MAARLYSGADGNYGGLAQIMRESAHRVLYITAQSNLMNGILPGSEFVEVMPLVECSGVGHDGCGRGAVRGKLCSYCRDTE